MITAHARKVLGGIFDPAGKKERLEEVEGLLANPDVWGDQEKYQQLSKEKLTLESINPSYPPMIFSGSKLDDIKIMGVVKKIIKSV